MELVLLGTVLVAAMATVDITEAQPEGEDSEEHTADQGQKPYGVHG